MRSKRIFRELKEQPFVVELDLRGMYLFVLSPFSLFFYNKNNFVFLCVQRTEIKYSTSFWNLLVAVPSPKFLLTASILVALMVLISKFFPFSNLFIKNNLDAAFLFSNFKVTCFFSCFRSCRFCGEWSVAKASCC